MEKALKDKYVNRTVIMLLSLLLLTFSSCHLAACNTSAQLKRLPTPEGLYRDGNSVLWQDNALYTDFIVSVDGEEYKTSEPSFDVGFALQKGKIFEVKVKAEGDGKYYKDSEWSCPYSVTPSSFSSEGGTYNSDDGTLSFEIEYKKEVSNHESGYVIVKCNKASGDVVLPQYFNGYPIIGLWFAAFENLSDITSVTIPRGYIKIGYKVFSSCENLKTLRISNTVAEISKGCFYECDIENIEIAEGNVEYKSEGNCIIRKSDNALIAGSKYSVIPAYVESIEEQAFWRSAIETVSIPNGVKKLDRNAFNVCRNLRSVEIPASLTDIHVESFYDCRASFTVSGDNPVYKGDLGHIIRKSDNVLYIGSSGDIVIPDYITGIGDRAFYYHRYTPASLIIPKSVTWMGESAFYGCMYLEYIYIPNTVKEVGRYAVSTEIDGFGYYEYGGVALRFRREPWGKTA